MGRYQPLMAKFGVRQASRQGEPNQTSERFQHCLERLMFPASEQGDCIGAIVILRIKCPSLAVGLLASLPKSGAGYTSPEGTVL